ncbi:MAG TPA: YihY/virulence factor BrkB family protein, partial [Gaiellaceae bacterium]|nr:YihY/virulence factor BrkB family protein [Gaiellaceae bacterium]
GLADLSARDYLAIIARAGKKALANGITDRAAALAYYSFLAIPAVILLAIGLFTLFASPDAIGTLIEKLGTIVPSQTTELLDSSLRRMNENKNGSLTMAIVGFVLALWTTTGAMTAFMRAMNASYERDETRGFVKQRFVAVQMVAALAAAFLLIFGLLVLGPVISDWLGSALDIESAFGWIWWIAQWPILIFGLLAVFALVLYLGPNVDHPRWKFVTPGSVFALVIWLLASAGFAVYTSMFSSYNKTWGSLAAVIVMLTWLWLTGIALLFGAEINAEAERSRELRQGKPAEWEIQAPTRA